MEVIKDTQEQKCLLSSLQKSKLLYRHFPLKDFREALPTKEAINDFIYIEKTNTLLLASYKKIYEYDLNTKRLTRMLSAHESNVSALAEIPAQYLFVSGGFDGSLILWEQDSLKKRREFLWGGWIYHIMALPRDGVVGFIGGRNNDKNNCVFGVWNYNCSELVLKVSIEDPFNCLTPRFSWLDEGRELLMIDKMNQIRHIDVRNGAMTELNIQMIENAIAPVNAICAYEIKKKAPKKMSGNIVEPVNPETQANQLAPVPQINGEQIEDDKSQKKILIFVGGTKGTVSVIKTDRNFQEFVELERRTIGDKPINYIQMILSRNNEKLVFIRSGDLCFFYDMDFTMLHSFKLDIVPRITKEFIHMGVDQKLLLFTSAKGDIVSFRLENLIKYFLLKLAVLKSNQYHPYIYMEVFSMLFSNENIQI